MTNTIQKTVKKIIIQKLIRTKVWGGKHMPLDFIIKGMPEHFKNTHKGKKVIEKILKELLKDEWIIILIKRSGKSNDKHISLNSKQVAEIKRFLV